MLRLLLFTAFVLALAAACSDKGSKAEPAPARPTIVSGATAVPPTDGVIDPLGFGGTEPVTVKANPDPPGRIAVLRDVRVGAHPEEGGWDRIVFEFSDVLPAGDVRFVPSVSQCGSGMPVTVRGASILRVSFTGAQAHNDAGQATIPSMQVQGPGNIILESRQTCDFEGHVDWAIGLRAEQRFKVTTLSNPTRLVIDVKH